MDRGKILNELRKYKPILEKKYGIVKLGIFGSVARGDMKNSSDIDIVVEFKRGMGTFKNFGGLVVYLENLSL